MYWLVSGRTTSAPPLIAGSRAAPPQPACAPVSPLLVVAAMNTITTTVGHMTTVGQWCVAGLLVASVSACGDRVDLVSRDALDDTQTGEFEADVPEVEDTAPDEGPDDAPDVEDDTPDVVDPCPPEAYDASTSALIGGRCAYFYNEGPVTWLAADAACHARNMRLIPIRSAEEDDELTAWITQHQNSTWIGLNDIAEEGTFVWSLGGELGSEEPTYLPEISSNSPDLDCVVANILPAPAFWLVLGCDYHVRSYTCTFD